MKYSIVTFGCRVNQADATELDAEFLKRGAQTVEPSHADLVVVNTCSVTASADQAARQMIRGIVRVNPRARIVVTGCYATRRPDEVMGLPGVVRVVPNVAKEQIAVLAADESELTTADRFGQGDDSCGAQVAPGLLGRTALTIRVQTGCAEPCSYCIIPSTRGAPRSVPLDIVLNRVDQAVRSGFKEIVLSGVHLGSYGRDLETPQSLVELLGALAEHAERRCAQNDVVFRISSLEPMDCSRELVDLVAERPCFAPHFHLPLQHASDRILAEMRRPYSLDQYARLVSGIRKRIPFASLGSDIIVGFPGETDDDFAALMAFLSVAPLTHLHVFPYSDRPGTVAADLPSKVPGAVIRERAKRVREAGTALTRRFHNEQVGTVHKALTLDDGTLAVTGNYLKVRIPAGIPRNEWVWLRIDAGDSGLTGTPMVANTTYGTQPTPGAGPETDADLRR